MVDVLAGQCCVQLLPLGSRGSMALLESVKATVSKCVWSRAWALAEQHVNMEYTVLYFFLFF